MDARTQERQDQLEVKENTQHTASTRRLRMPDLEVQQDTIRKMASLMEPPDSSLPQGAWETNSQTLTPLSFSSSYSSSSSSSPSSSSSSSSSAFSAWLEIIDWPKLFCSFFPDGGAFPPPYPEIDAAGLLQRQQDHDANVRDIVHQADLTMRNLISSLMVELSSSQPVASLPNGTGVASSSDGLPAKAEKARKVRIAGEANTLRKHWFSELKTLLGSSKAVSVDDVDDQDDDVGELGVDDQGGRAKTPAPRAEEILADVLLTFTKLLQALRHS